VSDAATFQLDKSAPDGLTLSGALVFATAASALAQARAALREVASATLDLRGVQRADSAGLAVLLALSADARNQARLLRLQNVPEGLRALAHLSDVESLLGI
jgi:phospholipid transport system transporter-binding protein